MVTECRTIVQLGNVTIALKAPIGELFVVDSSSRLCLRQAQSPGAAVYADMGLYKGG